MSGPNNSCSNPIGKCVLRDPLGSPVCKVSMLEMPPPNTITSGSNTFTSAAKLRASRFRYAASD